MNFSRKHGSVLQMGSERAPIVDVRMLDRAERVRRISVAHVEHGSSGGFWLINDEDPTSLLQSLNVSSEVVEEGTSGWVARIR